MKRKSNSSIRQHWFFGAAPVIKGEDHAAYVEIYQRIAGAVTVTPHDFVTTILIQEVTHLTWDTLRYRRAKAECLSRLMYDAIRFKFNAETANVWAGQDPDDIEKIETELAKVGLSTDALIAKIIVDKLETIEQLDRLISSAETRRHIALRELDRHCVNLARALRQASDGVVDAVFKDVPLQPAARKALP